MKMNKIAVVVAAGLAVVSVCASAESGNIGTNVQIVQSLTVAGVNDLSFGSFAKNSSGGSVEVTVDGATYGNAGPQLSAGSAGSFTVSGLPGVAYNYSIPASVQLTLGGVSTATPSRIITMSPTLGGAGSAQGGTRAMDTSGTDTYTIGGTIEVRSDQLVGSYLGSVTLTANYQ